jgi:DNA polymerase-3 subunit alpha
MNYNHRQTLDLFYDAENHGLTYFNDDLSKQMIQDLKGVSFDDLVVVFALSRPNMRPNVWEHYKSGLWVNEVEMPPFVQGLLARSSGLLIFQEQLVDILRSITGWPLEKANEVRQLMGKKNLEKLEPFLQDFFSELLRNPITNRWVFESRRGAGRDLWNHLIDCVPDLLSYKFSMSCTLHSYQIAYNLTHQ